MSRWVLALAAASLLGCKSKASSDRPTLKPDPVPSASASASASTAPSSSSSSEIKDAPDPALLAKARFDTNLKAAQKFERELLWGGNVNKDCGQGGRWMVPGAHAALVRFVCTGGLLPGKDPEGIALWRTGAMVEGFRLVGGTESPPFLVEEGDQAYVSWSATGGTWNLRGTGHRHAVLHLRSCPNECTIDHAVYRLDDHAWTKDPVPFAWELDPYGQLDVDKDGIPELAVRMWMVPLDKALVKECAAPDRVGMLEQPWGTRLAVNGLVSWVSAKTAFSSSLATFKSWYESRRAQTRARAKSFLAKADAGKSACAASILHVAAETYAYARMMGDADDTANTEAVAVMESLELATEHRTTFGKMREELKKATYPTLTDAR